MPSACPTPALSTEELLDQPQIITPSRKEQPLRSIHAIALAEYGHETKAHNVDTCGAYARKFVCPVGNIFHEIHTCHTRFCESCGPKEVAKLIDRHQPWINLMESSKCSCQDHQQFFILRIIAPCPRTNEAVRAVSKSIGPMLTRMTGTDAEGHILDESASTPLTAWWRVQGFQGDNIVCTILYQARYLSHSQIRSHVLSVFPNAELSVRVRGNIHFGEAFAAMAAYIIPTNGRERAEMEHIFHRVRQLHTIGLNHLKVYLPAPADPYDCDSPMDEEELFPIAENTIGNNSLPHTKNHGHICPCCKQPAVKVSQWYLRGMSKADQIHLKYFPISPAS